MWGDLGGGGNWDSDSSCYRYLSYLMNSKGRRWNCPCATTLFLESVWESGGKSLCVRNFDGSEWSFANLDHCSPSNPMDMRLRWLVSPGHGG